MISVMFWYFSIGFIYFILKGQSLTEFINHFSPDNCLKRDNVILNYL